MDIFKDGTLALGAINLINTLANVYWSFRLKSVQVNKELYQSLKESNDEKDEAIHELTQKKDQYKIQYEHLLLEHKRLEGKLHAYSGLHTTTT